MGRKQAGYRRNGGWKIGTGGEADQEKSRSDNSDVCRQRKQAEGEADSCHGKNNGTFVADAGRDKTRGKEREKIAAADKEKK